MQDIKTKITDIALEAFRQHGYDNVSVNEICRLCGITKKTFYYHFEAKDEILFNIFADYDTDMSEIAIHLMKLPNYTERLWFLYLSSITKTEKMGSDILKNLIKSSLTREKSLFFPTPINSEDATGDATRLAMEIITQGQQNGEFKKNATPEQLHWSFSSALLGSAVIWCTYGDEAYEKSNLRKLFEIIFLNSLNSLNDG